MLTPRKYQTEGINFLKSKKRAMLTDNPGLGKTLQAACASIPPVLVACPTYLTEQWADFLQSQYPENKISLCTGGKGERQEALNTVADWYVCNIEMMRPGKYIFPKLKTLIIDESHHVKNKEASQSKGALALARTTERVYLLTGTPITKDADDLYFQLKIINPQEFSSFSRFCSAFLQMLSTPWGDKVVGVRDHKALRRTLVKYALGRSYKEVGLQLPDLIENVIKINMPSSLMNKYKELKKSYRLNDNVYEYAIQIISVLRQMTFCEEKIHALADVLDQCNWSGVVYCWYRESAEGIAKGLEVPVINGDMSPTERAKVAKGSNLVVATLASLSEGVDLSHLRNVVFAEMDYTSGRLYQALSRVRRYSENLEPVKVHYLLMKDTIDETIYKMVLKRIYDAKLILREELRA